MCGLSKQVVSHGSGLSKQLSQYQLQVKTGSPVISKHGDAVNIVELPQAFPSAGRPDITNQYLSTLVQCH